MLALQRQASGAADGHGTVRISAPPAIAAHWIAPQLAAVRAQLHGVDIELAAEQTHADLARRDADIAIRFRRPQLPDLAVRSVASVQYYLCGHPDYLATHAQTEWEFIGYDDSLANTPQQEWLDAFAGPRRFIMRSNDIAAIYFAASAGLGIAVLPDYLAGDLIIDAMPCPVQRQLWLVIHADVRKSPRVRRVADLLADLLSRPAR